MKKLFFLIALLSVCSNANATDADNMVVPITSKVAGKAVADYTTLWWKWSHSMWHGDNPIKDRVGSKCHINQRGDVWFLAGGFGTSKIKRRCQIPQNKYLFFPVINMISVYKRGGARSCSDAKKRASFNNSRVSAINVTLDGNEITRPKKYRLKSPKCFIIPDLSSGDSFRAASDGYWIMLKPLPKGRHTLKFGAKYSRKKSSYGRMKQDIEYDIEVK